MTVFKSLLEDYVKKYGLVVSYGDNGNGKTKGFGTIKWKFVEFKNVSYVEGLKHNLVSISQMCDADYEVHFNKIEGKVIDSKMIPVVTANRQHDIYVLDMFSADQSLRGCFFSRAQSHMNWLWHKRLSHFNFNALSKISNDQLVRGLPRMKFEKDKLCPVCEKVKQTKVKCCTISKFDNFAVTMTQNLEISLLRTSVNPKAYLKTFSAVRTPQQNGVAERRNRTLIEAGRTMVVDTGLPLSFWAEAVNGASSETSFGYDLTSTRCVCYILNQKDQRSKFEAKADEDIFFGYSSMSKAFRVFNTHSQTIEESAQVKFEEDAFSNNSVVHPGSILSELISTSSKIQGLVELIVPCVPDPKETQTPLPEDSSYESEVIIQEMSPDDHYEPIVEPTPNESHVSRGAISNTLFIKESGIDLVLAQVYVDDIIFGSTNANLSREFTDVMAKNDCKPAKTPMSTAISITADSPGTDTNNTSYRGMIGSLLYLTTSHPDIMFASSMCARFQENPIESHLQAVKRIFRYLKHTRHLGLWYPRDSPFDLIGYTDADQSGCSIDYGFKFFKTPICCDNTSAILITQNPVQHLIPKHIEIRHHFIRDISQKGNIVFEYEASTTILFLISLLHNSMVLKVEPPPADELEQSMPMDRSCTVIYYMYLTILHHPSSLLNIYDSASKPYADEMLTTMCRWISHTAIAPLYVHVPIDNVVHAPNTPNVTIIINAHNVAFSPSIPKKLQDQGLEPFMEYFTSHPLRYALSDAATPFLPKHVCEFYYSCSFNADTLALQGSLERDSICALPVSSCWLEAGYRGDWKVPQTQNRQPRSVEPVRNEDSYGYGPDYLAEPDAEIEPAMMSSRLINIVPQDAASQALPSSSSSAEATTTTSSSSSDEANANANATDNIMPLVEGEQSDVESDDDGALLHCKLPSATGDTGSSRPLKRRKVLNLEELAAEWALSLEEAMIYSAEHQAAQINQEALIKDAEAVKQLVSQEGGEESQRQIYSILKKKLQEKED
ncbi:hypothetical protein LXL04_035288 [Taraxacum kok-saghyz]